MAKKKSAKKAAEKPHAPRKKSVLPPKDAKPKKRQIEQYDHAGAKRVNNPPVGLVTPETDPPAPARKVYQYDPHLDPQLVWAGKAEHTSFEVPTVSLHVHERIDPRTIIAAVRSNGNGHGWAPGSGATRLATRQKGLFEDPEEALPRGEAVEFYKHAHGWSNRLVAGDSLLVMNSLLEKEGMARKVQMIYIDPPYGIRYGSNFQPFVHQRDVKDRKDEDLTAEPEMLRAFRDTWGAIRFDAENTTRLAPVFDRLRPILTTGDMQPWYTGKPCAPTERSHINQCVFDSAWEASEAYQLDHSEHVRAWVKNDHLGFEVLYAFRGAIRKYRPDFLVRLVNDVTLILEVKGEDSDENRAKREYLNEWVRAVNSHGGFGAWASDVSYGVEDLPIMLNRYSDLP